MSAREGLMLPETALCGPVRILNWPERVLCRPERTLCQPERALFRSNKFLCWPEGPCVGLRGPSYDLPSKWAPFRHKRAICRCGKVRCCSERALIGLWSKWALFWLKRAICRCRRAYAALRGPSYGLQSKWAFSARESDISVGRTCVALREPLYVCVAPELA